MDRLFKKWIHFPRFKAHGKKYMRKAGIDKNIRMLIFGHKDNSDKNAGYDIIDDQDLLTAVEQLETFLEFVDQTVNQRQKNSSQNESYKCVTY